MKILVKFDTFKYNFRHHIHKQIKVRTLELYFLQQHAQAHHILILSLNRAVQMSAASLSFTPEEAIQNA